MNSSVFRLPTIQKCGFI